MKDLNIVSIFIVVVFLNLLTLACAVTVNPTPQEVEISFSHIKEIRELCEQSLSFKSNQEDFESKVARCTLDEIDLLNLDLKIEEICDKELSEEESLICEELLINL